MALAAGTARADPALWKVTGGASTVYLFGSVHLLPEGGFTVGGELADALKRADRVCMFGVISNLKPLAGREGQ